MITGWVTASEACRLLKVSRATLYAYVSRGLIHSQPVAGRSRERRYAGEDVERLRQRARARRDPDAAAAEALHWGMTVLESSITLIDGARLYYRGHDATVLAGTRTLDEVVSLLWTGGFDTTRRAREAHAGVSPRRPRLPFIASAQSALAEAAAADPRPFDGRPADAARCGWRILDLLTTAAGGDARAGNLEVALARAWNVAAPAVDVIRAALILCADHELNVSAFTARCVASAGSTPYAVVIAGLAALEGTRHGGAGARVESMLDSTRRSRDLGAAIAARLRRGETVDGFGHPLYRRGDPRAALLLEMLRDRYPRSPELRFVSAFAAAASAAVGEPANLDFALSAVARVLRLPAGSPLVLFGIGRTAGWIGHAIEQYATGQLIRPRAKYVGPAIASA